MGYYVTITSSTFTIPRENLAEAYRRLVDLNQRDELKQGGRSGGKDTNRNDPRPEGMDHHPARWFAWMDANYPEKLKTPEGIFEAIGFEIDTNEAGDLLLVAYDNKTGQEDLFLATACDLARGEITWEGEDRLVWKDEYGGETVRHFDAADIIWIER